jgi:hypothetical protein
MVDNDAGGDAKICAGWDLGMAEKTQTAVLKSGGFDA